MAKAGWLGAALVAMGMAGPLAAQELDPRVAGPLMHDVLALALPRYAVEPSGAKGVKLPLQ